jgi:hypothetical protein
MGPDERQSKLTDKRLFTRANFERRASRTLNDVHPVERHIGREGGLAWRVVDEKGIRMKAKDNTGMTSEETTGEILPCDQPSDCLICVNERPALLYGHWLCYHCKNVVQAEALAQKRNIIKEDRGSSRSGSSCGKHLRQEVFSSPTSPFCTNSDHEI